MKKKILAIGIIAMLFAMLIVLTGCRKTENENINETVESRNQISSSENQVSNTSNNDEEISKEDMKEKIEEYIKNINNRNIDEIMNMYDIDGINEYKKEISNSDKRISESDLKNLINKQLDRWERYEEINYKLIKFDIVHDISDIEEMHKKMGSENPNISDEYRNGVNEMLKNYTMCYTYYNVTFIHEPGKKVEEEMQGQIIWNKENGKIVMDSIIVL